MLSEFFANIVGDLAPGKFLAAFVFALVGIFLSLLMQTTGRDPNSQRSPVHFSWNFLFCDNALRLYKSVGTTVLLVFVGLRFAKELFGVEISMFFALLLGLGIDKIFERLKKKKDDLLNQIA